MAKKKRRDPRAGDGDAFIPASEQVSGARDPLAEMLAEEYLRSAVSGESIEEDERDQIVEEELGGPFVEPTASEVFGLTHIPLPGGHDDATTEPSALPAATGPLAIAAPDEDLDDAEDGDGDGDGDDDGRATIDDALLGASPGSNDGRRLRTDTRRGSHRPIDPSAEPASKVEPARPKVAR